MAEERARRPVSVRFDDAERQTIKAAAELEEQTVHDFLRKSILGRANGVIQMAEWVKTYEQAGE